MALRERPGGSATPEIVPIFPLPGVLLLPRTLLPLHIFEPRYRNMTRDAIAGEQTIAMVQPSGAPGDDADNPPVFPIGCLGRIAKAERADDGRYMLMLVGVSRFRIVRELPLHEGYRRVIADYEAYRGDLYEDRTGGIDRAGLLAALRTYLNVKGLTADWDSVEDARDEALVTALAMMCPFTPSEKQALLECADVAERAHAMITLFRMSGFVANDDAPVVRH